MNVEQSSYFGPIFAIALVAIWGLIAIQFARPRKYPRYRYLQGDDVNEKYKKSFQTLKRKSLLRLIADTGCTLYFGDSSLAEVLSYANRTCYVQVMIPHLCKTLKVQVYESDLRDIKAFEQLGFEPST